MIFLNLFDRLLRLIGLSRARVTRYYANAAAHNQRALDARIVDMETWRSIAFARQRKIEELTEKYMAQCDAQAAVVLERVLVAEARNQNDRLIGALTGSAGAQWAGAEKPEIEIDPTL